MVLRFLGTLSFPCRTVFISACVFSFRISIRWISRFMVLIAWPVDHTYLFIRQFSVHCVSSCKFFRIQLFWSSLSFILHVVYMAMLSYIFPLVRVSCHSINFANIHGLRYRCFRVHLPYLFSCFFPECCHPVTHRRRVRRS